MIKGDREVPQGDAKWPQRNTKRLHTRYCMSQSVGGGSCSSKKGSFLCSCCPIIRLYYSTTTILYFLEYSSSTLKFALYVNCQAGIFLVLIKLRGEFRVVSLHVLKLVVAVTAAAEENELKRDGGQRQTDRQYESERQGQRWRRVGWWRAGSRAFLVCVGAWLRVQSCRPPSSTLLSSPLLLLLQRQAKAEGGATDLTVNRRWVYSSPSVGRLRRQKPTEGGRHQLTVR